MYFSFHISHKTMHKEKISHPVNDSTNNVVIHLSVILGKSIILYIQKRLKFCNIYEIDQLIELKI